MHKSTEIKCIYVRPHRIYCAYNKFFELNWFKLCNHKKIGWCGAEWCIMKLLPRGFEVVWTQHINMRLMWRNETINSNWNSNSMRLRHVNVFFSVILRVINSSGGIL